MIDANIQTRKLLLIEQFARITDIALLTKIEALLHEAEIKEMEQNAPQLTEDQGRILDEAYQEYLDNPNSAMPWNDVKHELYAKYGN